MALLNHVWTDEKARNMTIEELKKDPYDILYPEPVTEEMLISVAQTIQLPPRFIKDSQTTRYPHSSKAVTDSAVTPSINGSPQQQTMNKQEFDHHLIDIQV